MNGFQSAINRILSRFTSIFKDSPAWAEFTSASAGLIFCFLATASIILENKQVNYISVFQVSDGNMWLAFAFNISLFQFFSLLAQVRLLRSVAAFAMLVWHVLVVFAAWPIVPWAPFLAFPVALCIPNFFAIARHARDWGS